MYLGIKETLSKKTLNVTLQVKPGTCMVLTTLNLISVTVTKISQFIFCKRLSFYFQQFDTISKPFFLHITADAF